MNKYYIKIIFRGRGIWVIEVEAKSRKEASKIIREKAKKALRGLRRR